ncbi:MAG: hypothetical protein U5R48_19380 [Gammaproteobacteria bacterium]|nr:hypothetical protein [Gammaproteobacteria bacterium]
MPGSIRCARPWRDRWRTDGGWSLPSRDRTAAGLPAGPWSPDWQLLGQRHGGIALVRGEDWLLAMPALMDGRLRWGCFSTLALDGCRRLEGNENFGRDLVAGEVGPGRLRPAAEQAGPAAGCRCRRLASAGAGPGQRRVRHASGCAGARQRPRRRSWTNAGVPGASPWISGAATAFAAQDDAVLAQSRALEAMALLVATDPAADPPRAARHMLDCRRLREKVEAPSCIRSGEIGARLEARALESGGWGRVRWWYEQAVAEREPAGARGLARILALGRTGEIERRRALALIEDVAERWEDFGRADAAATAAGLSDIWTRGLGRDSGSGAGELVGLAGRPARRRPLGAAPRHRVRPGHRHRAGPAAGPGPGGNLSSESMPLFEVAFLRSVGRHLLEGDGVGGGSAAGPRLAAPGVRALSNAGGGESGGATRAGEHVLLGEGVEADAGRAARMYAELLEHAPRVAGNMLAWIRATHPDPALRDGAEALRHRPAPGGTTGRGQALAGGSPRHPGGGAGRGRGSGCSGDSREARPGPAGAGGDARAGGTRHRGAPRGAAAPPAPIASRSPWRDPDFTYDPTRNTG